MKLRLVQALSMKRGIYLEYQTIFGTILKPPTGLQMKIKRVMKYFQKTSVTLRARGVRPAVYRFQGALHSQK